MGRLEGKIALVTGGTSGIGLATAKRFVNEGAYVFVTGRRHTELAAAVKEVGKNVTAVQGDVSSLGDLDRLFAQIKQEKSRLDIVFANAGVAKYATMGEITEELYDSIFDTNVKGLLFTVQKALPLMSDGASIILNASIVASKGLASNSVYSATKAAVRSFARTWTTDLRTRRIRVNAVSPGSIDTPGLSELLESSETGQQRLKMLSTAVPLGRLGKPDEIASAVVFLASDDASYIQERSCSSMAGSLKCRPVGSKMTIPFARKCDANKKDRSRAIQRDNSKAVRGRYRRAESWRWAVGFDRVRESVQVARSFHGIGSGYQS